MKIRTIKYFLKEGFSNIFANKWMSIASAGVVLTTLYIFGIFFLLAVNIDSISSKVEDQPLEALFVETADSKVINDVTNKVKQIKGVKKVTLVTKEEGFNELKQDFAEYADLLNGLEPKKFLPDKLVINIDNPSAAQTVKSSVESIEDIKKVNYKKDTMEKLLMVTNIVRILSYVLIVVLGGIALFIVVYTIKLTVFARRREINIMKYVGATDWFIKWPFIIEGVVIGLAGAFAAIFLMFTSYNFLFNVIETTNVFLVKMIPLDSLMKNQLFYIFTILGSGIGAVGSIISVRKYLYV